MEDVHDTVHDRFFTVRQLFVGCVVSEVSGLKESFASEVAEGRRTTCLFFFGRTSLLRRPVYGSPTGRAEGCGAATCRLSTAIYNYCEMNEGVEEQAAIAISEESSNSMMEGESVREASEAGSNKGGTESDAEPVEDSNGQTTVVVSENRTEVRKMRRIMANRRSARESRERRKRLLDDLQDSVDKLLEENTELARENKRMRQELVTLLKHSGLLPAAPQN